MIFYISKFLLLISIKHTNNIYLVEFSIFMKNHELKERNIFEIKYNQSSILLKDKTLIIKA